MSNRRPRDMDNDEFLRYVHIHDKYCNNLLVHQHNCMELYIIVLVVFHDNDCMIII